MRQNQAAATNADPAEAVAGAAQNGLGMNQIVNRLRDFLAAVELNFPAEPRLNQAGANNNNNNNNENPNQEDEYQDHDEFD